MATSMHAITPPANQAMPPGIKAAQGEASQHPRQRGGLMENRPQYRQRRTLIRVGTDGARLDEARAEPGWQRNDQKYGAEALWR
jgi:hypothetical protein